MKNNSDRLGKTLQATLGAGARLRFFEAPDSSAEAEFICGELSTLVRNDPDARIAVLYRTGAQSRSFEEVLRRLGIRYRVVGGFSFYDRAEVRNALAYVRLIFHPGRRRRSATRAQRPAARHRRSHRRRPGGAREGNLAVALVGRFQR